jgi:hypothetical protein
MRSIQDLANLFPRLQRLVLDCPDMLLDEDLGLPDASDIEPSGTIPDLTVLDMEIYKENSLFDHNTVDDLLEWARSVHGAHITLRFVSWGCVQGLLSSTSARTASVPELEISRLRSLRLVVERQGVCNFDVPFWVSTAVRAAGVHVYQ